MFVFQSVQQCAHRTPLTLLVALLGVSTATGAVAGPSPFETFTPLAASVPGGSLPEAAPLLLSSPKFKQKTLSANDLGAANGGVKLGDNWDMITSNQNGPSAG